MRFQCRHCQCVLDIDGCAPGETVVCGQCGKKVEYPLSYTSPTAMLGDFAIVRELGQGGMGKVYLARQVSLDRNVALKILSSKYAEDSTFIQHFIHEARVAASLNHPNIVQAYAVSMENGLYYFAMEYVEGKTLKLLLQEQQKMPARQVLQVALDIVSALEYAWRKCHLLHRDIKPDNIMITQDGRTKLADLGLAGRPDDGQDGEDQELYGTPQYIAPELLLKYPHDPRSDMYSLGATLYQALTGQYPFMADSVEELIMKHGRTPLTPVASLVPEELPGLATVVEKLLAKRPVHRYQTFAELQEDLQAVRDGKVPSGQLHPASQIPLDYEADDPMALPPGWETSCSQKPSGADGRLFHDEASEEAGAGSEAEAGGHRRAVRAVMILVVLLLAGAGWYFLNRGKKTAPPSVQTGAAVSSVEKAEKADFLELLKKRVAEEGFSVEVQEQIVALSRKMDSGSPEYQDFMKLCSPWFEENMRACRETKLGELKKQWQKKMEQYRLQAEQEKKAAALRAEKQRIAAEAAAEKKRLVAEAAKRAAEVEANKRKTVEDMFFYARNFDFDSAIRGFKMLAVGLEGKDRGWCDEWLKCLRNADKAYSLIHDSDRKLAGLKLAVGQREWIVEEIQFDDLTVSLVHQEKGGRGSVRKIEKVLNLGVLRNVMLQTIVYAAMEKAGMAAQREEYFGCLLWCRGGAEVYAGGILGKNGGYKRMVAEEPMLRQAYVRSWLRHLASDKYSAAQTEIICRDLRRRYGKETQALEKQLQKIIAGKKK